MPPDATTPRPTLARDVDDRAINLEVLSAEIPPRVSTDDSLERR